MEINNIEIIITVKINLQICSFTGQPEKSFENDKHDLTFHTFRTSCKSK